MIDRDLMIGALTRDGIVPATLSRGEAEKLSDAELCSRFLELEKREAGINSDKFYAEQKAVHGSVATFAWIGSALYLYLSPSDVGLFSVQAVIFIVVGMFAAAIVFGSVGYGLQRGIARALASSLGEIGSSAVAGLIVALGVVLMICEIVAVFWSASWLFSWLNA